MNRLLIASLITLAAFVCLTPESPAQSTPRGQANYDRKADQHPFTVFLREGGWCWYQDPRAIIHREHVILGGVRGNGSGAAVIGDYDLRTSRRLPAFVAHESFDHDDHNVPVFFPRSDGSVLTVYARHGRESRHYFRISDTDDFTAWGPEQTIEYAEFDRDRVTYMNLYQLSNQNRLYNFFRGIDYNPSVISSGDEGLSWGELRHFIQSDLPGRHRPYARYAGNGIDTIHVSFTDAHPHRYGNSIYYAAFRGGSFYRADGTHIKSLQQDGPLRPGEAELVFQGGQQQAPEATHRGVRPSARRAAWTSSIAFDAQGHPHIAYSVHYTRDDLRYRLASWDGQRWVDREIAHAGKCLYDMESSYTGLITLDPRDPTFVVISTDVHPGSGQDSGGRHEIYSATVGSADSVDTIAWNPVTQDSPVRNIRPVILRDDQRRIILWNRGDFRTYTDYQMDTVGLIQPMQ